MGNGDWGLGIGDWGLGIGFDIKMCLTEWPGTLYHVF